MRFYVDLFLSFFKIGAFTLGGGYVMIPLIEKEVVERRQWIAQEQFSEMLTLAQSAPGPISINTAVFVGYKMRGWRGVIATVLGAVIPAFVTILVIALFFSRIRENAVVERIFCGIRPAVVALIAVPVLHMLKGSGYVIKTLLIAASSAMAVWWFGVSPIWVILVSCALGLFSVFFNKKE